MKTIFKPIVISLIIQVACVVGVVVWLAVISAIIPSMDFEDSLMPALGWALFISSVVTTYILYRYQYFSLKSRDFTSPSQQVMGLTVGLAIPVIFLADAIMMPFSYLLDMDGDLFEGLFTSFGGIAAIVIMAPIEEEILFRGIVLKELLRKHSPKNAILISSVIFGIIHGNLFQLVFATVLGIILGYVYYKTGSIFPGMLIHFLNNATTCVVAHIYPEIDWFLYLFPSTASYLIVLGSSVLLLVGCLQIFRNIPTVSWSFTGDTGTELAEELKTEEENYSGNERSAEEIIEENDNKQ